MKRIELHSIKIFSTWSEVWGIHTFLDNNIDGTWEKFELSDWFFT